MDRLVQSIDNVRLTDAEDAVVILDQSLLPGRTEYRVLSDAESLREAIFSLRVRGAPAIGICAGYGMYLLARRIKTESVPEFLAKLRACKDYLDAARPTAVNLSWATARMVRRAGRTPKSRSRDVRLLGEECRRIQAEDAEMCRAISEHGLTLLRDGDGVLTHCNAGPLATSRYGTALGPLLLGTERGMRFRVFADETRPLLQGARLTTYELSRAGVDVTLICDNMASIVMKNGWVNACFVGCDRVAANGDAANKIGHERGGHPRPALWDPLLCARPTSTIDRSCKTGAEIEIELRDPEEIRSKFYREPMAPEGVRCYNPAFDVTDHSLITGIVTERGVCRPPYTESLAALFSGGDDHKEGSYEHPVL